MHFLKRILPSFLASWLIAFTLASLFHSQYVVNQLMSVGVVIELSDRIKLSIDDWLGLLSTYGIVLIIALALAFLITAYLVKRVKAFAHILFSLAGVTALAVVLLLMQSFMNIHIIAGARGFGFYAQLLAGAVSGFIFSFLIGCKYHHHQSY